MTSFQQKSQKLAATIETIGNRTVLKMSDGSCLTWGFVVKHQNELHEKDSQVVRNIIHAGYRIGADLANLQF